MTSLQNYINESLNDNDIYKVVKDLFEINKDDDKSLTYDYNKYCKEYFHKMESVILKNGGKKHQHISDLNPGEVLVGAANMDVIYFVWKNSNNKYTRIAIGAVPASERVFIKIENKRSIDDVKFIWEKGTSLITTTELKDMILANYSKFAQDYYA